MSDAENRTIADHYNLLIGGELIPAEGEEYFTPTNPSTEESVADVARGREADVDAALDAAQSAQQEWATLPGEKRSQILQKVAEAIREESDYLAELITLENGKPLASAEEEVESCARRFDYFAGFADKIRGDSIPLSEEYLDFTLREPLGVTAQIIPWNGPVAVFGRSVAPALATGNVSVAKPPEQTPISVLALGAIIDDILPDGVVNVVSGYGDEAGAPLSGHPAVEGISFTGSTQTGKAIAHSAADNVTPVHLELGGKSPQVVYPDADFENAVQNVVTGFTFLCGQLCLAGTRLLVHEEIHDEFLQKVVAKVESISVDAGMENPDMGPLASEEQYEKVLEYLEIGKEEVGEPVVGGGVPDREGYFVEPTIFDGVENEMRIAREEIFGPVLSVITFSDEEEAIEIANDTNYGLYAGVFTTDLGKAIRFSKEVEAGHVSINDFTTGGVETPFGGYKDSGYGREMGSEVIDEYTQVKNVCAKIDL